MLLSRLCTCGLFILCAEIVCEDRKRLRSVLRHSSATTENSVFRRCFSSKVLCYLWEDWCLLSRVMIGFFRFFQLKPQVRSWLEEVVWYFLIQPLLGVKLRDGIEAREILATSLSDYGYLVNSPSLLAVALSMGTLSCR